MVYYKEVSIIIAPSTFAFNISKVHEKNGLAIAGIGISFVCGKLLQLGIVLGTYVCKQKYYHFVQLTSIFSKLCSFDTALHDT